MPARALLPVVEAALRDLGVGAADPVLVACSGGPDSAALADLAMALAAGGRLGPVTLVHVDHRLRPGSGAEAAVVRRLGEAGGAAVRCVEVEVDRGVASLEQAAREARYAALDRAREDTGARWVLTAHTASDQAETVLMRVLRGAGVTGLAGIPARRGVYVRPLLGVSRAAIEAHVADRGLETVVDPSNEDLRFLRNRIRHRWLPALRQENPALEQALCRLANAAAAEREVLDWAAGAALEQARHDDGIDLEVLGRVPVGVRRQALARACREAGGGPLAAEHLAALDRLAAERDGSASIDLPGTTASREYDRLRFGPIGPPPRPPLSVHGPDGPYAIRAWRAGDRMCPARLRGHSRKLSDLYVDAKIPRRWRNGARVVIRERDGVIQWAEHLGPAWAATCDVSLTTGDPVASNKGC